MRVLTRNFASIAFALGVLVVAPAVSHAQNMEDADTREISGYKLTEAGLGKYTQATRNLKGLPIDDCDEDSDDDSDARSLSEAVAKMDSAPGAKAAVQSAGMTTREYVVFTFSLMQSGTAAWALEQPGGKLPPGVSQANVDFFRAHAADMKKMGDGSDDATCDAAEDAEDGE
jgi:hypothetical protein